MRGKIIDMNLSDINRVFGYIQGTDDKRYYFNQGSIDGKKKIDEFYEGDEVEFTVEKTKAKYDRACHLLLVPKSVSDAQRKPSFYSPGISSRLDLSYGATLKPDSGEKEIIEKFGEVLYISRIGYHRMDQVSKYEFCLAGATSAFQQFIRENGEFIIVFSHFDGEACFLQQKVFTVEREIRKRREIADRRPLVNFYILVSNAVDLIEKVDARKGDACASVIPFTFQELYDCVDAESLRRLMLKRFAEYYFENNMLGENEAIDDDNLLFGDRGKLADSVVARCRQGQNSGIFGLRRSGKSSVLHAVLRRLDREEVPYVLIESRTYETSGSWQSVLFDIFCAIKARTLNITREKGESRNAFLKRLDPGSTETDYKERGVACFIDDVQSCCQGFDAFVIALDEVELITYNTATSRMWQSLESYKALWSALRGCGCSLVVCGVNSTINEVSNLSFHGEQCDNPMYGRIINCSESAQTYLPPFTAEQTKSMINTLGSYSNIAFSNVYDRINTDFGGQPWAIRQFCAYVFDQVKDKRIPDRIYETKEAAYDNLIRKFRESAQGINLCKTILQHLSIYKEEYSLLKKLAHSPQQYGQLTSNAEAIFIDHLEKYGLIHYDSDTGYVSFRINIIREYICKNEEKDPNDMTNDERIQFAQDRIHDYEVKLKTYIHRYYSIAESQTAGKTVLLKYTGKGKPLSLKNKKRDPTTLEFRDFFDHTIVIFYFSALKTVITGEWTALGKKFEQVGINQSKFISCMEAMNDCRSDADHYDSEDVTPRDELKIDDIMLRAFRSACDTLDAFFDSFS